MGNLFLNPRILSNKPSTNLFADDSLFKMGIRQQFSFLNLPTEIRLGIYEATLVSEKPIDMELRQSVNQRPKINSIWLRLCRQTQKEAAPILYGKNTFSLVFHNHHAIEFIEAIGKENAGLIKHINAYTSTCLNFNLIHGYGPGEIAVPFDFVVARMNESCTGVHKLIFLHTKDEKCFSADVWGDDMVEELRQIAESASMRLEQLAKHQLKKLAWALPLRELRLEGMKDTAFVKNLVANIEGSVPYDRFLDLPPEMRQAHGIKTTWDD
jgi:hypothetical protein